MNIVQEPEVSLSTCVASSPNSCLHQVLVVFLRLWNQSLLTGSCWFWLFSLTWSSSARAFPPSTPCTHSSMTRHAFFLVILNPMFCLFRLSIPEIAGWWENHPSVQTPQNDRTNCTHCSHCTNKSTTLTTTSMLNWILPVEWMSRKYSYNFAWNNEIFVAQLYDRDQLC